ncbi:MAG: four helix bundle protein [Phycisphaerales bacterium]|nr:four helix bundle protein [Phycisphaerales bacterium]
MGDDAIASAVIMATPERIETFRELRVYQAAFEAAMEIFRLTKAFPPEEKYSLTDQIRRSSRSVCTNIAEAWRKRRYRAAFIAKLSDSETEAAETQVWLDFSFRSGYIDVATHRRLDDTYNHIIAQLVKMMDNPEK